MPSATDLPRVREPQASVDVGGAPQAAAPAAAPPRRGRRRPPPPRPRQRRRHPRAAPPVGRPRAAASGASAADVADQPAAVQRRPIDPTEYGQEGTAARSPEGAALLKNKNLEFDSVGVADLKAGKIDPRVVAVLTKLSEDHKLKISCMCSDHPKFTTGGSSPTMRTVAASTSPRRRRDRQPGVGGGARARDGALGAAGKFRPDEIGSPWPISGPGYFTDAGHQDHVHVGFKTEIDKSWAPPADVRRRREGRRGRRRPAAAAAGARGARRRRPPQPRPPRRVPGRRCRRAAPEGRRVGPVHGRDGRRGVEEEGRLGRVHGRRPRAAAAAAAAAPPAGAGVADAAAAAADLSGVWGAYPGDDAPKEQLAAWLGKEAEKRGLPKELPVMASLVESGVKNLNFGDADSVGFFQMRVGIWNQGEYAGFPEKPELQAKWFLDQAEAVKKQRISRGQSVDDPQQFGEWIADIERPAEQYRGRYQLRLDEARGLLSKAAHSAPAAPAAAVDPAAAGAAPAAPAAAVDRHASGAGGSKQGAAAMGAAREQEPRPRRGRAERHPRRAWWTRAWSRCWASSPRSTRST